MNSRILENLQVAVGFVPLALTTARDGDWVNLTDFDRVLILFLAGAGTAGDDPTLTLQQATDNAAGGAKELNFDKLYVKQGADLTAIGQFTETTNSGGDNTYTHTDSAEAQKLWAVEIAKEDLDVDNGFTHVRARISDVGTNAQLGTVIYLLMGPRHASKQLPSAL